MAHKPARMTVLLMSLALLLPHPPAPAQPTYKCLRDGSIHYSDRPCEIDSRPVLSGPRPAIGEAPAHWRHLGAACRQLADRVRRLEAALVHTDGDSAASEQVSTEQQRYNDLCWDEDQGARRRVVELARDEHERRRALQLQAETLADLCSEMRRIRDLRRARLSQLTAGERSDFERFEANFNSRCAGVPPRAQGAG